jgi:hypothetical protein
MLTDEQCEVFRRMEVSVDNMIRAAYEAGYKAWKNEIDKSSQPVECKTYFRFMDIDGCVYSDGRISWNGEQINYQFTTRDFKKVIDEALKANAESVRILQEST